MVRKKYILLTGAILWLALVGSLWGADAVQEKLAFEAELAAFSVEDHSSKQIQDMADGCLRFGYFTEAREFYEYILENDPPYEGRIWTHANLIKTEVELWRYDEAAKAADKLLADYAGDANLVKAAEDVAGFFKKHAQFDKALPLYKYAAANTEESERTIWTYEGLAVSSASLGDANSCEAAKAALLAKFADNANLPQIMTNIGHEYRQAKNFAKARETYAYVMANHRTSAAAVWCQMGTALCSVAEGDQEKAAIETDALIIGFTGNQGLANAVYTVAKTYEEKKDFVRAKAVYQKVMDHCSESPFAAKAQVDMGYCDALALVEAGDDDATSEIDAMVTAFAGSPYAAQKIYEAGLKYIERVEIPKAKQVFGLVIEKYPAGEWAMWSQSKLGILAIVDGNDAGGVAAVNRLIANYPEQIEVHKAVYQVGEELYYKAFRSRENGQQEEYRQYLTKAKDVWERILTDLPQPKTKTDIIGDVHYSRAVCYRRCGEYQKALDLNQKVLDEHPSHPRVWSAQYLMGECFQGLAKQGLMPQAEADVREEEAYKAVVNNWPGCGSYIFALLKLGSYNYEQKDWYDTAMYYEMYMQTCAPEERLTRVLYRAGKAYEELGASSTALEYYREYIGRPGANKFIVGELKARFAELRGDE